MVRTLRLLCTQKYHFLKVENIIPYIKSYHVYCFRMASAPALPPSYEEVMSEGDDLTPPPYSEPTPGGSTQGANQGQGQQS